MSQPQAEMALKHVTIHKDLLSATTELSVREITNVFERVDERDFKPSTQLFAKVISYMTG